MTASVSTHRRCALSEPMSTAESGPPSATPNWSKTVRDNRRQPVTTSGEDSFGRVSPCERPAASAHRNPITYGASEAEVARDNRYSGDIGKPADLRVDRVNRSWPKTFRSSGKRTRSSRRSQVQILPPLHRSCVRTDEARRSHHFDGPHRFSLPTLDMPLSGAIRESCGGWDSGAEPDQRNSDADQGSGTSDEWLGLAARHECRAVFHLGLCRDQFAQGAFCLRRLDVCAER